MSHLRKKIRGELWDNNIRIYCDFIPIINQNCLEFYDYEGGSHKHLFYYLYDKTKSLKKNINEIKILAIKFANYREIENCKLGFHYMTDHEYEACNKNCFYFHYCKLKEG